MHAPLVHLVDRITHKVDCGYPLSPANEVYITLGLERDPKSSLHACMLSRSLTNRTSFI